MLPAGSQSLKVWRIRNIGTCAWQDYTLEFVGGDRMSAYSSLSLPAIVEPGQLVDLAVELVAPAQPGHYRSYWMLSDASGEGFGIGERAQEAFWADLYVVVRDSHYPFDFVANMCAARWRNNIGPLPCPGDPESLEGSVVRLDAPILENGRRMEEPALWTRPWQTRDGWIEASYPAYGVQAGDHFVTDIGCLAGGQDCDLTFSVSYQVAGNPVRELGSWREVYDRQMTRLDIDLSPLAGQAVQFVFKVTDNGPPSSAGAFWLAPVIRRVAPTAIPGWESLAVIRAARESLAQGLGMSPLDVVVDSVTPVEWGTDCLDLELPGRVCAPASIPGYRILLSAGARLFEAHCDQDGTIIYWFEL